MKRITSRSRTMASVALEWDRIAAVRSRQIGSGADHSALEILAPLVGALLGQTTCLLDVGCGTGWLTDTLAKRAQQVVGVDASGVSIKLARRIAVSPNVKFVHASLEVFSKTHVGLFSAAVANMTLSTVPNLRKTLQAIRRCLEPNGIFIFTIPHPCFWPTYWGYADEPWFDYNADVAIAAPFRIGSEETDFITTHVHRPLHRYVAAARAAGFELELLEELVGRGFARPRFIGMRWRRRSDAHL